MPRTNLLTALGYSKNESAVYESLLQSGQSSISLISKNTGIYRPAIYKLLPRLVGDGLVSKVVRGKIANYIAESPKRLELKVEDKKKSLEYDFRELLKFSTIQADRPVIKYLEGKKGIRMVYDDVVDSLDKHGVYYRYSSRRDTTDAKKYISEYYREQLIKKQIERFVISGQKIGNKKKPRLDRAMKIIPDNVSLFEYDITLLIYADKVAVIDYNSQTAFIVENKIFAEFQKNIFLLLYNKLK
jgi:sugar-specific transcriptional regulator TrmB